MLGIRVRIKGGIMPFITQQKRDFVEAYGLDGTNFFPEVGDRCYFFYKDMVRQWKENPRWRTAHQIYKDMVEAIEGERVVDQEREGVDDDDVAYQLAWQVFFMWWVVPYEKEKEKLNGPIE
jgi:hypothetical protein